MTRRSIKITNKNWWSFRLGLDGLQSGPASFAASLRAAALPHLPRAARGQERPAWAATGLGAARASGSKGRRGFNRIRPRTGRGLTSLNSGQAVGKAEELRAIQALPRGSPPGGPGIRRAAPRAALRLAASRKKRPSQRRRVRSGAAGPPFARERQLSSAVPGSASRRGERLPPPGLASANQGANGRRGAFPRKRGARKSPQAEAAAAGGGQRGPPGSRPPSSVAKASTRGP